MNKKFKEPYLNIGTGKDFTITDYAKKIIDIILKEKKIKIRYDFTKPNGMKRKVVDVSLAKKYGWAAKIDIDLALKKTYKSFLTN